MKKILVTLALFCAFTSCAQQSPAVKTDFKDGSKVVITTLTPGAVKHLEVLGRVWGFVKYYHPAVAKGLYNWDYELFAIMPKILDSKTAAERNAHISKWIAGLGEIEKGELPVFPVDAKLLPDLDWITDQKELGEELSGQLQQIRAAKRVLPNYYVTLATGVGNPVFANENAYDGMPYPDAGYSLLALFRFWNMVQYFSPYRKHMDENWNNVLPAMIPTFAAANDKKDYQVALMRLAAKVQDAHTGVGGRYEGILEFFGQRAVLLKLGFVEGKVVVKNVLAATGDIKAGDVLLSIDHEPVEKKVEKLRSYIGASNEQTFLRNVMYRLLQSNDSLMHITYERNGITKTAVVPTQPGAEAERAYAGLRKEAKKDTSWKFLAEDIGYIYPGTISLAYIPKMMSAFKNTKGIVIDMRCYPSAFIPYALGEYLLPEKTEFAKVTLGDLQEPGLFKMGPGLTVGKNNPGYYKGKVVILFNEDTQSQAEFTTMAFQRAPQAVTVGSPTAGVDGNYSDVSLPGGIRTGITGLGIYYPDGRETQRVGLIPDVAVLPTIKAFREGRDELLEKAMEIIRHPKSATAGR